MGVGGSSAGGAIRAGLAFVELSATDNKLIRALDNAKQKMQAFGAGMAKVGAATAAAGGALLGPVAGLFASAVNRSSDLATLANEFGTTTEKLSAMGYAFETAGIKQDEFADTLKGLSQKLSAAADGGDETFDRLGLSAQELIKLPVDEQFNRIADALARVPLAADRTNMSLTLFGGAGSKLNRILAQGSGEMARLTAEAETVGAVMSGETASAGQRLAKTFTRLESTVRYAFLSIGEALFPQADAIEEFSRGIGNTVRSVREWIGENKQLVVGAVAVGAALVAVGTGAIALGTVVQGLAGLVSGTVAAFTGAVSLITGAFAALASPLGIAAAALAGLGYLFVMHTETGKQLASVVGGELSESWNTLRDTAVGAWTGIGSALKRGDLRAAGEIALAGLTVAFQQGMLTLRKAWLALQGYFVDGWSSSASAVGGIWTNLIDKLAELFVKLTAGILSRAAGLAGAVGASSLESLLRGYEDNTRMIGKELEMGRKRDAADRKRALEDELKEREAGREKDLGASKDALEMARAKFADLLNAEAAKAAQGPPDKLKVQAAAVSKGNAEALASATKGAFSSPNFRLAFGIGDTVAQRSLTVQKETRDAVLDVGDAIKRLDGGRFT